MRSAKVMLCLVVAGLAGHAAAQTPSAAGAQSPQATRSVAEPAKLICHDELMPGTRLQMRHTCGTKAQWREYQQNIRYDMDRVGIISSGQ